MYLNDQYNKHKNHSRLTTLTTMSWVCHLFSDKVILVINMWL